MSPSAPEPDALPADALLHELRAELLTIETRTCLLPGHPLAFGLMLEGRTLPLSVRTTACLVVGKDRGGRALLRRAVCSRLGRKRKAWA